MTAPVQSLQFASELVDQLQHWRGHRGQLLSIWPLPPHPAQFSCFSSPLDGQVANHLPGGIAQLYHHQVVGIEHSVQGHHITLATPTASGKTLTLALPGKLARGDDSNACILCLAPTRALVEQWYERLTALDPGANIEVYTGDTPKSQRAALRDRARWLVTTPDMLHLGLLPYHMHWHFFLSHLRYVIIDEAHIYRGVFGSHMAQVLRRLRRVAAFHQAPQVTYLLASATIGNPAGHAEALVGLPVIPVTQNGAPSGGRLLALWQPPEYRGHGEEAAALMAFFVEQGVRTILFGQARQSVERMLREVRSNLPDELRRRVAAYRAGYLVEHRKRTQQALATGDVLGVVATNALELGIDIGALDVSILDGFPGSIASFWQQAGRAGRGARSALTILVLREDALDQYFATHPERLVTNPVEQALVNLANPYIVSNHLLCAAHERPLTENELDQFGPKTRELVSDLVKDGYLFKAAGTYRLRGQSGNPAYGIDLRQAGRRLPIRERSTRRQVEETDYAHALLECYPGAIYFSQGTMHVVHELDLEQGTVWVDPVERDYYTQPLVETEVTILREQNRSLLSQSKLCLGQVRVTRHVRGFARRQHRSRNLLGVENFTSPLALTLETSALWISIAPPLITELINAHLDPAGSLHAAEHGMIALLPLYVMGDRRDVGGVSIVPTHPQTERATIFIYDGYPGGMGYAEEAYRQSTKLTQTTQETIAACSCETGCYACVQSPKCGNQNRPLDKAGAVYLLKRLVERRVQ